ncbi:MAG: pyruvate kinase [Micrococcales bacterium]|nr:MAG: pyruvate kinase [Micrococcales bacterium]
MRRAKIVCTLGPSTNTYQSIKSLIHAGMNVARINLSHGSHEEHHERCQMVRQAAQDAGRTVAILADLQGPKIRLGTFADGPIELVCGDTFTVTTRDVEGDKNIVGTTYSGLAGDVRPGDKVLVDDGKVDLEVTEVRNGTDVLTRVVVGGTVSDHKGFNLPGAAVNVPALTDKDEQDLRWALEEGVDLVALSFVRAAADIEFVHEVMNSARRYVPVIAKMEKPQAVAELDEIVEAFDGMMVARGDLGVELPLEEVPLVQKDIVRACRYHSKPVIVATQVLESMINAPRPTRAEASDAANAVLDGADALMLSGETSVGKYPHEAVRVMDRIITSTEQRGLHRVQALNFRPTSRPGAVSVASVQIAETLRAKFVVCFTHSGKTAKRIARLRSWVPLLAFSPIEETQRQLAVTWGVESLPGLEARHTDQMVLHTDKALLASGRVREGDYVVIVAGAPPGVSGRTNLIRVHKAGEAIRRASSESGGYGAEGKL